MTVNRTTHLNWKKKATSKFDYIRLSRTSCGHRISSKPVTAQKLRSIGTSNSFMSCFCCSDKPLALYIFSNDKSKIEKIMNSTSSGGFLANDTVVHVGGK